MQSLELKNEEIKTPYKLTVYCEQAWWLQEEISPLPNSFLLYLIAFLSSLCNCIFFFKQQQFFYGFNLKAERYLWTQIWLESKEMQIKLKYLLVEVD